jgi:hypothetical protein
VGVPDGIFGKNTEAAVVAFQKFSSLNADGIVGGLTWRTLFGEEMPSDPVPDIILQGDLLDLQGSPLESAFAKTYIKRVDLSEFKGKFTVINMISSRGAVIECNKLLEKPFKQALQNLIDAGIPKEFKVFDGCYNVRNSRGKSHLSTHAWGMAVDINAMENPFQVDKRGFSKEFIKCFAAAGFENGGLWNDPIDWMHFQLAWTRDWTTTQSCKYPEFKPQLPQF